MNISFGARPFSLDAAPIVPAQTFIFSPLKKTDIYARSLIVFCFAVIIGSIFLITWPSTSHLWLVWVVQICLTSLILCIISRDMAKWCCPEQCYYLPRKTKRFSTIVKFHGRPSIAKTVAQPINMAVSSDIRITVANV